MAPDTIAPHVQAYQPGPPMPLPGPPMPLPGPPMPLPGPHRYTELTVA